jgi:ATP-dependent RNA helicase DDX49/DBP8
MNLGSSCLQLKLATDHNHHPSLPSSHLTMPPTAKRQKTTSGGVQPAVKGKARAVPAPVELPLEVSAEEEDADDGSSSVGTSSSGSDDDLDGASEGGDAFGDDNFGEGPSRRRISVSVSPPPSGPMSAVPSRVKLASRASALPSRTPAPRKAVPSKPAPAAGEDLDSSVTTTTAAPRGPETFSTLGISQQLLASLGTLSIRRPTPIQGMAIPSILAKRDVIGISPTGSGKTLAFALPILQRIAADPFGIWAVVLTPTRELAFQIAEQFHVVGVPLGVRTSVVVGGMDVVQQGRELRDRPGVVVATPGRLRDLLGSSGGEWGLDRVQTLVSRLATLTARLPNAPR